MTEQAWFHYARSKTLAERQAAAWSNLCVPAICESQVSKLEDEKDFRGKRNCSKPMRRDWSMAFFNFGFRRFLSKCYLLTIRILSPGSIALYICEPSCKRGQDRNRSTKLPNAYRQVHNECRTRLNWIFSKENPDAERVRSENGHNVRVKSSAIRLFFC